MNVTLRLMWNTVVGLIDPIVISAIVGAVVGALLSFRLMWFLYDKNFKREKERELLEKRLEKLYSPLYSNIEIIEAAVGESKIGFKKSSKEEGEGRMKIFLDQLIEQNLHLASEELRQLLVKMHGAGFYKLNEDEVKEITGLIKNEFKELQDKYRVYL